MPFFIHDNDDADADAVNELLMICRRSEAGGIGVSGGQRLSPNPPPPHKPWNLREQQPTDDADDSQLGGYTPGF